MHNYQIMCIGLMLLLTQCSPKKADNTVVEPNRSNQSVLADNTVVEPNRSNQSVLADSTKGTMEAEKSNGLRSDLEKYEGFYTSIEMTDGKISPKHLPEEILSFKKSPVKSVNIEYLNKINNGYILTFTIDFSGYKALILSTLNSEYKIVDYRIYPNGQGLKDIKKDTITFLQYSKNSVTAELMRPNEFEEPEFSVDGIRREELNITEELKIK